MKLPALCKRLSKHQVFPLFWGLLQGVWGIWLLELLSEEVPLAPHPTPPPWSSTSGDSLSLPIFYYLSYWSSGFKWRPPLLPFKALSYLACHLWHYFCLMFKGCSWPWGLCFLIDLIPGENCISFLSETEFKPKSGGLGTPLLVWHESTSDQRSCVPRRMCSSHIGCHTHTPSSLTLLPAWQHGTSQDGMPTLCGWLNVMHKDRCSFHVDEAVDLQ